MKVLQMILRIGNSRRHCEAVRPKQSNAKRRPRNGSVSGLTLIEVLMAVSVLAIGTVGVLSAYAGSISVLEAGQYSIDGVHLVKQKMADVEQMLLEEEKIIQKGDSGTFKNAFSDFSWKWEIKPTETEGLNTLTLVVSNQYNPRKFSLSIYVLDAEEEEEE